MLSTTLQQLIDNKLTTAREVGELAGVSTSTVYRWITGESRPDFDSVRLLIRLLPDRRAQEALLGCVTAGTDWRHAHLELDLDVNHDGRVDAEDALDASIQAVRAAGESLHAVREAGRGKSLDEQHTAALISRLNHVIRQSTVTQRILVDMAESRKKAKLRLAE